MPPYERILKEVFYNERNTDHFQFAQPLRVSEDGVPICLAHNPCNITASMPTGCGSKRSIKRKKLDCDLDQTRIAWRERWFFRVMLAAMCHHLDAWAQCSSEN